MAARYFIDSNGVLVEYAQDDGPAVPTGLTAVEASVIEAAYSGDIYLGGTWNAGTSTYTPPAGQITAPSELDEQLRALHDAYVTYNRDIRKQMWVSLSDGVANALTATDRWIYHQVALGDRIVRSEWLGARTQTVRDAAVDQIVRWVRTKGYVWYSVMLGDATKRNNWATGGTGASETLYTDLLVASGANAGDVRTPDGSWNAVALAIHANFNPELPSLRST